jgi:hypothetical protein
VLVTHGFADTLARLLQERGLDASVLATRFTGEATPDVATRADAEDDRLDDGDRDDSGGDDGGDDPERSEDDVLEAPA